MGMVLDLIRFLLDHAGPAVAPLIRQWIDLRGLTPPDLKAWSDIDAKIDAAMSAPWARSRAPEVAPLIRQWIDMRAWADVYARIDAAMSARDTDPAPAPAPSAPSRPAMRFSGDD